MSTPRFMLWRFHPPFRLIVHDRAISGASILTLFQELMSLRHRLAIETDHVWLIKLERDRIADERDVWRERAAMLERNLDEIPSRGRRASRWQKRRRRRAAPGFELGKVRWARVSKITCDGVFVRINGVDWQVNIPELSWGDAQSPADIVSVGETVGVRTLSTPAHSTHPFLVLM
jgi:hypothetical protein